MKLIRLKIEQPFRSLQAGFELHFLREWELNEAKEKSEADFAPYVLAGPNGSGKSNVLELLAAIFYHLECIYLDNLPESFIFDEDENPNGFQGAKALPDAFEIEYLIPVSKAHRVRDYGGHAYVRIVKQAGKEPQWSLLNFDDERGEAELTIGRTVARDLLPDFVLGYSSGENEILSLPFFKARFIHYDEYLDSLKQDMDYPGKPESRHTYLDTVFSQANLLSNLLFQDQDTLKPFRQEVGIEGLKQFRVILKRHIQINAEEADNYPSDLIVKDEGDAAVERYYLPLLSRFESSPDDNRRYEPVINRLIRCATCHYTDSETDTLYLDYWVNEATIEAFKNNFESAIDLFQSLQILLTLNLYSVSDNLKSELYRSSSLYVNETVPTLPSDERITRFKDLVLKKRGVESTVYAKSLSDGEHQFLHTLGLCLLYRESNCLFLLDEPETHFNPEWRSKLISRIRDCFIGTQAQREMLITTHTPFLISDSRQEHVLEFKKEGQAVSVKRPEYNTLGASINKITLNTFAKKETIGGYAQKKMESFTTRFESGEDAEVLIDEIHREMGDSVEKVLLLRSIINSLDKVGQVRD
ncbi:MAG: restriction system-associated AAA family ATPase [Candidatus Sedimenticola sp. (ex Thyasira tokunagai)]